MRVLVGCERSGQVTRAFRAEGHSAYSVDILPPMDEGSYPRDQLGYVAHLQGDIFDVIRAHPDRSYAQPDLLIAHPPCTYFSVSGAWAFKDGPYHQKVKPGTLTGAARRKARAEAFEFFMALWNAPIERICLENPIGSMSSMWRKPDQIIQPYEFGDDASKATCLWLKNLPPLVASPGDRVPGRMVLCNGKMVERWSNQTDSGQNRLTPSDERAGLRAVTYPGIAAAMAKQWGGLS